MRWTVFIWALFVAVGAQAAPFSGGRGTQFTTRTGGGAAFSRSQGPGFRSGGHGGDPRFWRNHDHGRHDFDFRHDLRRERFFERDRFEPFVDNGWSGFGWPLNDYERPIRPLSRIPSPVPYPIVEMGETVEKPEMAYGVQQTLKSLGFYEGAVDGKAGPTTRAAIVQFQIAHQIPATGLMDAPLLRELGIF